MKQIITEIFIEVEETLVVRPVELKTKSGSYPPGIQTICGHCGQIIRDPQILDSGDVT